MSVEPGKPQPEFKRTDTDFSLLAVAENAVEKKKKKKKVCLLRACRVHSDFRAVYMRLRLIFG